MSTVAVFFFSFHNNYKSNTIRVPGIMFKKKSIPYNKRLKKMRC